MALPGELSQELPRPVHFEDAVKTVRKDDVAERIADPLPARSLTRCRRSRTPTTTTSGSTRSEPDQEAFFDLYEREVMPALTGERPLVRPGAEPS